MRGAGVCARSTPRPGLRTLVGSAIAAGTLTAACSGLHGLTGGAPDGEAPSEMQGDAAQTDGATMPSAGDAGHLGVAADGGSTEGGALNVLTNPSFELGCAGWQGVSLESSESSEARTGMRSCQLCITHQTPGIFWQDTSPVPVKEGERYQAELWLRAAPDASALAPPQLRIYVVNGNQELPGPATTAGVPGPSWGRVTALMDAPQAGTHLQLVLYGIEGTKGQCLLIDDAALYRVE